MSKHKRHRHATSPKLREVELSELLGVVERARSAPLSETDYATLKMALDTLGFLTQELAAKGTTIERLRKMLFGASTEKTSAVVGQSAADNGTAATDANASLGSVAAKPKSAGHGRNGAASYPGAHKVKVPHPQWHRSDGCPGCQKGKLYPLSEPAVLVRVAGMAPLGATIYELDRLRCNLCGEVFTAPSPDGVGNEKYDETAASMVGLLKYGAGLPFNRIEKLQQSLGIPLPAATQWQLVQHAGELLESAVAQLIDQAAQGEVLHNDDTTAKILELSRAHAQDVETTDGADTRTGVFTTGIVAKSQGRTIALFFTGQKHAGENLADVLAHRAAALAAPIQMCDALSRNLPRDLQTIVSNCLAHCRRRFVDVVNDFPDECRHLLQTLREVYKHDALAREQKMSPEQRLLFHQEHSRPIMDGLGQWLREQVDDKKVEPNSGLGEAIGYMRKHWTKLTLFLRVADAPLDNNLCERVLKRAILHRKNALFYRTQNGAHVGDMFMSVIHTAELNGANPFDYLVALQRHHQDVAATPADWMPWNYAQTLAHLGNRLASPA